MTHNNSCSTAKFALLAVLAALLIPNILLAQPTPPIHAEKARVVEHWTKERMANAIPRELVIDQRGLGYLRRPDGALEPYGHQISAQSGPGKQTPVGKPVGGDTEGPVISPISPEEGEVISASHQFSALITDPSGIKSVSFVITNPDGATRSFKPGSEDGATWQITLQGFSDGNWSWHVVAKDRAAKGGNRSTSAEVAFSVDTGGSGGTDVVANEQWTDGGTVQTAAGRIYFEMPRNAQRTVWVGYVCSGTVADDATTDRSVIITASHCVYDDANKAFARNVLFIPNQAGTSGSGTDTDCSNDPLGCWVPSFGVVDINWTTSTFPANIEWDYAYYVVSDTGAHDGAATSSDALDTAAGSLPISFDPPFVDSGDDSDYTHALGYSYSDDPNFMYCAEDMTKEGDVNWWLPSCELSGGSSGGPWIQPMGENANMGWGPIISVNSWGYTNSPGMAGPILFDTSAECLFSEAKSNTDFIGSSETPADGDAGVAVDSCP